LPAHPSDGFGIAIVESVLALNRVFPTDSMATAVRVVCVVFMADLLPIAIPVAGELFTLFHEYSRMDPGSHALAASWIHKTIERLLEQMNMQNQEFWDFCVLTSVRLVDGVPNSQWLVILGHVVRMAPCMSAAFECVPGFLLHIAQEWGFDGDCMSAVADAIAWLALRAPDWLASETNWMPVIELLVKTLEVFDEHKMELCDSVTLLSQTVFVVMREYERPQAAFQIILPIVTELRQEALADVIAALATMFPIQVLADEANFTIWIACASPAPFLLSALSLMRCEGSVPLELMERQEIVNARVAEQISDLRESAGDLAFASETIDKVFNCQAILEAFGVSLDPE
jgi:hypothetical protein